MSSTSFDRERLTRLFIYTGITIFTASTLIPIIAIIIFIIAQGAGRIDFSFLFSISTSMANGGILAPIVGTILLTVLTMAIATPFGVLVAVYMAEYARKHLLFKFVELTVLNLASIPSVVYGLFGLGIFVVLLQIGVSLLAGALTLACLILPLVISVSYQAMMAVPASLRQAASALGASKLQTTYRIILPAAAPNILTGVILATARVAGETAPVLFTAAAYSSASLPRSIFDESMLLSYHLYTIATQVKDVSIEQKYGVALVLILLVLVLNSLAILIRNRLRKKLRRYNN